MARRRGRGALATDAFELFLDTISNTFGGIIFISLLVSILLQMSSPPVPPALDPQEQLRLEEELKKLQIEIKDQLAIHESQLEQIKTLGPLSDPELLRKYLELAEKTQALRARYQVLALQIGLQSVSLEEILRRIAELQQQMQTLDLERTRLADALQKLRGAPGLIVRVPTAHTPPPGAGQVPIMIHDGRVVMMFEYDSNSRPTNWNDADVDIKRDAEGKFISGMPKAGRGTPVENTEAFKTWFEGLLRKFPSNRYYFTMAAWPESYDQCAVVRDILISHGYIYGLVLPEQGESVTAGETSVL